LSWKLQQKSSQQNAHVFRENSKNSVTIFVDPLMLIALLLLVEAAVAAFWRVRTRVACIADLARLKMLRARSAMGALSLAGCCAWTSCLSQVRQRR
jgi:hypothetical protein